MRRKFSTPVWIDTPLKLYQVLNSFSPKTRLKLVCRNYAKSSLRTVDGAIQLQLEDTFLLYQLIRAHRPYVSVDDLVSMMEQHMTKIIYLDRRNARNLAGKKDMELLNKLFSKTIGKDIEIILHCYASAGKIVKSELSFVISQDIHPIVFPHFTNSCALLYLKRSYLEEQLAINPNRKIDYHTTVDAIFEEFEEAFGSDHYMKLHTLRELITS